VIAGKEYGTGSSRDWAAKGPKLLGVRAVIAESFERIHRSNLVGMGILPLQFLENQNADTLQITGKEEFTIAHLDQLKPSEKIEIQFFYEKETIKVFTVLVRIDTPNELEYFRHGGILPYVLRQALD
jgi:aconitate hydratase